MKEKYQAMSVIALKELAKMRGIRGISSMKKNEVVDLLVADDEKRRAEEAAAGVLSAALLPHAARLSAIPAASMIATSFFIFLSSLPLFIFVNIYSKAIIVPPAFKCKPFICTP